jgi:hypothetical protein
MKDSVRTVPEAFFDFFAYLLPGYLFWIVVSGSTIFPFRRFLPPNMGAVEKMALDVFAGYCIGHLLTVLSTIIVAGPLNVLLGNPIHTLTGVQIPLITRFAAKLEPSFTQELLQKIQDRFGLQPDRHSFFLCENYVRSNNKEMGFLLRKRHGFEHLFRNLLLTELVFFVAFPGPVAARWLFGLIMVLTFLRYADYRTSWPKAVYENFFLLESSTEAKEEDR